MQARHNKILLLEAYWDKMIFKIVSRASKKKDYLVMRVINQISKIPEKIRYEILKRFVQSCRWVYAIGFFQWRLNNPNTLKKTVPYHDKEFDIMDLIPCYIDKINKIPFEP